MVIRAYCDGGVMREKDNKFGVSGIAYAYRLVRYENEVFRTFAKFVPTKASNNVAEITAAIGALKYLHENTVYRDVVVCTDSSCCIYWLMNPNKTSRDGAFRYKKVMEWLHWLDNLRRQRKVILATALYKGHPTPEDIERGNGRRTKGNKVSSRVLPASEHQDWCDKACGRVKEAYMDLIRESTSVDIHRNRKVVLDDWSIRD